MRIGIVTVFKTNNCGSYLQAWALNRVLRDSGHKPFFVNYKSNSSNWGNVLVTAIKCGLKAHFKIGIYILKRKIQFDRAQRVFNITSNASNMDLCIYGSDTIWNFADPFFRNNAGHFLGKNYCGKKIGYAISIGSSSSSDFRGIEGLRDSIDAFDEIALRDEYSLMVLQDICPKDKYSLVVDPTMLLTPDDYNEIQLSCSDSGFILFYYFGGAPEELIKSARRLADLKGLKLVSIGSPNSSFDKCINNIPGHFLSYMKKADYVVTNTFHGCVFSILFNKQFVANACEKKKIISLLTQYNLNSRMIKDYDGLSDIFNNDIDYRIINSTIKFNRDASIDYLLKNIY